MASASGTYTGNNGTDRTISLAFTPKFVVVINETASQPMYLSNINAGAAGYRVVHNAATAVQTSNAGRPAPTTNGFIVSGSAAGDTNRSPDAFYYFAAD